MFGPIHRKQHSFLVAIYLILIVLNSVFFRSPVLGALLLGLFLFSTGRLIGPAVYPNNALWAQTAVGALVMTCMLAIVGSLIYYVGPAYHMSYVLLLIVSGISATLFGSHGETVEDVDENRKTHPMYFGAAAVIVLSLAAWWGSILPIDTTEAIRTPWEMLSPFSLSALGLALFCLAFMLKTARMNALVLFLMVATFFSAVALALTAYPLGFGFDPFIHRATVQHIVEHGTITPKPLYYIGQYALELLAVHGFAIPLQFTDRILVPLLASLIISVSAAIGFSSILKNKGLPALLAIFLLPLSAFIVTTPQSLAYVFTISLMFLSLPKLLQKQHAVPIGTLFILTLAALFTHPLAGIPAGIYFALVFAASQEKITGAIKHVFVGIGSIGGAFALPIVFIVQAKQSGLDVNLNLGRLFNLEALSFTGFLGNKFSTTFDGLYLVIDNLFWILLILAIVGAIFIEKHKGNRYLHLPLIAAIMWIVNYWLLSTTLEFSFLIEYERQNYALRLLTLASIFLIPHAGIAIAGISDVLKKKHATLQIAWLVLLTVIATANIYGAYPRHDNYARSSGFNVASTDFDAVYAINEEGDEDDYIVLANQAVSAAALEAFGFKQYYDGDVFYYPIPTGGRLYQYYLDMTDDNPSRDLANEAMDFAGVDRMFFVVNDYWWHADIIIERAKNEADAWFSVGNGSVTVFEYLR